MPAHRRTSLPPPHSASQASPARTAPPASFRPAVPYPSLLEVTTARMAAEGSMTATEGISTSSSSSKRQRASSMSASDARKRTTTTTFSSSSTHPRLSRAAVGTAAAAALPRTPSAPYSSSSLARSPPSSSSLRASASSGPKSRSSIKGSLHVKQLSAAAAAAAARRDLNGVTTHYSGASSLSSSHRSGDAAPRSAARQQTPLFRPATPDSTEGEGNGGEPKQATRPTPVGKNVGESSSKKGDYGGIGMQGKGQQLLKQPKVEPGLQHEEQQSSSTIRPQPSRPSKTTIVSSSSRPSSTATTNELTPAVGKPNVNGQWTPEEDAGLLEWVEKDVRAKYPDVSPRTKESMDMMRKTYAWARPWTVHSWLRRLKQIKPRKTRTSDAVPASQGEEQIDKSLVVAESQSDVDMDGGRASQKQAAGESCAARAAIAPNDAGAAPGVPATSAAVADLSFQLNAVFPANFSARLPPPPPLTRFAAAASVSPAIAAATTLAAPKVASPRRPDRSTLSPLPSPAGVNAGPAPSTLAKTPIQSEPSKAPQPPTPPFPPRIDPVPASTTAMPVASSQSANPLASPSSLSPSPAPIASSPLRLVASVAPVAASALSTNSALTPMLASPTLSTQEVRQLSSWALSTDPPSNDSGSGRISQRYVLDHILVEEPPESAGRPPVLPGNKRAFNSSTVDDEEAQTSQKRARNEASSTEEEAAERRRAEQELAKQLFPEVAMEEEEKRPNRRPSEAVAAELMDTDDEEDDDDDIVWEDHQQVSQPKGKGRADSDDDASYKEVHEGDDSDSTAPPLHSPADLGSNAELIARVQAAEEEADRLREAYNREVYARERIAIQLEEEQRKRRLRLGETKGERVEIQRKLEAAAAASIQSEQKFLRAKGENELLEFKLKGGFQKERMALQQRLEQVEKERDHFKTAKTMPGTIAEQQMLETNLAAANTRNEALSARVVALEAVVERTVKELAVAQRSLEIATQTTAMLQSKAAESDSRTLGFLKVLVAKRTDEMVKWQAKLAEKDHEIAANERHGRELFQQVSSLNAIIENQKIALQTAVNHALTLSSQLNLFQGWRNDISKHFRILSVDVQNMHKELLTQRAMGVASAQTVLSILERMTIPLSELFRLVRPHINGNEHLPLSTQPTIAPAPPPSSAPVAQPSTPMPQAPQLSSCPQPDRGALQSTGASQLQSHRSETMIQQRGQVPTPSFPILPQQEIRQQFSPTLPPHSSSRPPSQTSVQQQQQQQSPSQPQQGGDAARENVQLRLQLQEQARVRVLEGESQQPQQGHDERQREIQKQLPRQRQQIHQHIQSSLHSSQQQRFPSQEQQSQQQQQQQLQQQKRQPILTSGRSSGPLHATSWASDQPVAPQPQRLYGFLNRAWSSSQVDGSVPSTSPSTLSSQTAVAGGHQPSHSSSSISSPQPGTHGLPPKPTTFDYGQAPSSIPASSQGQLQLKRPF